MKKVVEDEIVEELFIDEKSYQQLKKKMCKSNDYFSLEEINNIQKMEKDFSVILA